MWIWSFARHLKNSLRWWQIREKLERIELVVLDVDGVLTDCGLWYGPSGELIKRFNVRDGLGIRLLQEAKISVAVLSGGKGGATEMRAKDLGIQHCIIGAKDKPIALKQLRNQLDTPSEKILFVGDDINDLSLHGEVALLIATSDASQALHHRANATLQTPGGHGAVRELAERLLKSRGLWKALAKSGWRDRND